MKFKRVLDLKKVISQSSSFLFGARGTGKSFLIRETLASEALVLNLLKTSDFLRLSENPSLLEDIIRESGKRLIVIDEIQKLPSLLDEVHRLIEEQRLRFLLTGSSARKLKRGKANMLAGRARLAHLCPLTHHELSNFKLPRYLLQGGLPTVWTNDDWGAYLDSYIDTYLKEEVLAEQAARSLPHFARFLKVAALCSGELVNFDRVASDCQLPATTVKNYFEVLQDTLLGSLLEPWVESKKRKAIATAKFYWFDIGVRNRILNLEAIPLESDIFGKAFEHFIFMELRAFQAYSASKPTLTFWRSVNKQEVDLILGNKIAIEVKAKKKVSDRDAKNLFALKEEKQHESFIVVSQDPIPREKDGISYLHWEQFLRRLWGEGGRHFL